jgi:hypothetical protein
VKPTLGASALKLITGAVDSLFRRLRGQVLGDKAPEGKALYFSYKPTHTLSNLFGVSSAEEGVKENPNTLGGLLSITSSYLDAAQSKTKAKVTQAVQSYLAGVGSRGDKTDIKKTLGEQLSEVMAETHHDVKRILETEGAIYRNVATLDGIGRNAAAVGVEDPVVFFVIVRDSSCCADCRRLHMLEDGKTPRVWLQSELQTGYWKRGSDTPSICGVHPHCRCLPTSLFKGYGFNSGGFVTYISPEHDEFQKQRLDSP